ISTQPKRSGGRPAEAPRRPQVPDRRPREAVLTMKRLLLFAAIGTLAACAPASAAVIHTVQPGETLWSIAAANGFTTRALAASNGVSENSNVILGSQIKIPSVSEAAEALQSGTPLSSSSSSTTTSGAPPLGGYTVRPGDSLTAIAARSGVPMIAVANMNGVDPSEPLLIGTVLKLPTGASVTSSTPAPSNTVVPNAPPYPTHERVNSTTI